MDLLCLVDYDYMFGTTSLITESKTQPNILGEKKGWMSMSCNVTMFARHTIDMARTMYDQHRDVYRTGPIDIDANGTCA